jgi:hypothetical protein
MRGQERNAHSPTRTRRADWLLPEDYGDRSAQVDCEFLELIADSDEAGHAFQKEAGH